MPIDPRIPALPGVREVDFCRYSSLHGAGHVNRVIVLGQALAAAIDAPYALRLALWAAAYTHDRSRRHEDTCYHHGRWAAEERLPELWAREFKPRGLLDTQYKAVEDAVIWHSRADEPPASNPHYHLIALMKDSDALDRCRLGPGEFDPKYLRIEASQGLIEPAKQFYTEGHASEDIEGMWAWWLHRLG